MISVTTAVGVTVAAVAVGAAVRFLRLLQRRSLWRGPVLPADELPQTLPPNVSFSLITPEDGGILGTRQIAVYHHSVTSTPPEDLVVYSHGVMHHCEDNYEIFNELEGRATVVCWD